MYPYISLSEINRHMDEMIEKKVSIKARSAGQFLDMYRQHGASGLPDNWKMKRNAFIARSYASYKLNPTRRRYLSLMAWAFKA